MKIIQCSAHSSSSKCIRTSKIVAAMSTICLKILNFLISWKWQDSVIYSVCISSTFQAVKALCFVSTVLQKSPQFSDHKLLYWVLQVVVLSFRKYFLLDSWILLQLLSVVISLKDKKNVADCPFCEKLSSAVERVVLDHWCWQKFNGAELHPHCSTDPQLPSSSFCIIVSNAEKSFKVIPRHEGTNM